MQAFILSGRVTLLILAFAATEAVVLVAYHRRTGRGIAPYDLIPNLGAGASLVLALRSALTGAGWGWIGLWLVAAGVAHVVDQRRRWGR